MIESLTFVLLLIVAAIVIVVLGIICIRLQAQATDHANQFSQLQLQLNERARQQFADWRDREMQDIRAQLAKSAQDDARNALQLWQMETEANIRADAIRRSSAVVTGKVTEHLTPYMGAFPYNPKDARFLGAPIDLIVFDGMSDDDLQQIVFLEVKTNTSTLSTRERRIRDAIQGGRVIWREYRVGG